MPAIGGRAMNVLDRLELRGNLCRLPDHSLVKLPAVQSGLGLTPAQRPFADATERDCDALDRPVRGKAEQHRSPDDSKVAMPACIFLKRIAMPRGPTRTAHGGQKFVVADRSGHEAGHKVAHWHQARSLLADDFDLRIIRQADG